MSWIIENLVRNSLVIKSKADLESDDFNNLLIIESKIKDLIHKNLLSPREERILNLLSEGSTIDDIRVKLKSNRITVAKEIRKACELIAYYLGGEFTDEGYLDYMQNKYKLSDTDIRNLKSYMNGKHSKRLSRKRINVK